MSRIAAVVLILSLAGCGTKGALELPPGPPATPLLGPSTAQPAAGNVSTPPGTNPQ